MLGSFIGKNGRIIGTDGLNDGRMYVMKTPKRSFDESGEEAVPGAGLSRKDLKQAIEFIETNTGNAEAFANNDIAYRSSIEIESNAAIWGAMFDIAGRDNGKGGTGDDNNREYGGYIDGDRVIEAKPGDVVDITKKKGKRPMITINSSIGPTFHTHASGSYSTATGTNFHTQHPSKIDVESAGRHTHYVFGQREKKIYIYNAQGGIQAVISRDNFKETITPKKPN